MKFNEFKQADKVTQACYLKRIAEGYYSDNNSQTGVCEDNNIPITEPEEAVKLLVVLSIANSKAAKGYCVRRDKNDWTIYTLKNILLKKIVNCLKQKYVYLHNDILYFFDRHRKQISFHLHKKIDDWFCDKELMDNVNCTQVEWDKIKNSAYYRSQLVSIDYYRYTYLKKELDEINAELEQLKSLHQSNNYKYLCNGGVYVDAHGKPYFTCLEVDKEKIRKTAIEQLTEAQLQEYKDLSYDIKRNNEWLVIQALRKVYGNKYGIKKVKEKTKKEAFEKYKEVVRNSPIDTYYLRSYKPFLNNENKLLRVAEKEKQEYLSKYSLYDSLKRKKKELDKEFFIVSHNLIEADDYNEVFVL
jgi:hypothetical protein